MRSVFRQISGTFRRHFPLGISIRVQPSSVSSVNPAGRSASPRIQLCIDHAHRLVKTEGEKNAIRQMRGQAPWYVKGLRGSAKIKNHLTQMNTLEELETILKDFEKELEGE